MSHRDAGSPEDRRQGRGVDRERVHERRLAVPGDLDERQIRDVGALGVEFGVEAVRVLRRHLGHQGLEPGAVDHRGRGGTHRCVAAPDLGSGALVFTARVDGSMVGLVAFRRRRAGRPGVGCRPGRLPGVRRGRAGRIAQAPRRGARFRPLSPVQSRCRCPAAGVGERGRATFGAHLMTYGSVSACDVPIRVTSPYRRGTP